LGAWNLKHKYTERENFKYLIELSHNATVKKAARLKESFLLP
jgi:hypothetical protein